MTAPRVNAGNRLPKGWQHDEYWAPEVHGQIAQLLAQGMSKLEVARRVGVSDRTVQRRSTGKH